MTCLATVLGFATSAVIAEVRDRDSQAVQQVADDVAGQFRPLASGNAPAFAATAAPALRVSGAEKQTLASARATFISSRTRGWVR